MRRVNRRIVIGSIAILATVAIGPKASAATTTASPSRDRGEVVQERVKRTVTISAESVWFPVGAEGGSDPRCVNSSIQVYIDDDFAVPVMSDFHLTDAFDGSNLTSFWFRAAQGRGPGERLFSPTGRWFGAFCDGSLSFVPEGGPSITIPGLVQRAVDSLDPPDPPIEVTPHHGRHVVRMQSWLAVDPLYWNRLRQAQASSGRVTVTAWLDPYEVAWDMGNEDVETCPGPGLVYRPGMDDSRATCHYTYLWPSINPPDHTYQLAGTVRFNVGYATNAPGTYGPFLPVERTTAETVQVVEIQAVES